MGTIIAHINSACSNMVGLLVAIIDLIQLGQAFRVELKTKLEV